jgi:Cu(I)/Ag(I) efflux system membrane fusion protein
VDAARERLLRLEMSAADVEQLEKAGRALETVTFRSPADGIIVEKAAVRGMHVVPGQMLYRVADLSTVWVETEVLQTDLPRIRLGTRADVSVPAYPERTFHGRVSYVYPTVNEQTRTARVRVVLANPAQMLKPNMFTTVVLHPPGTSVLVLPADAVVSTGTRQVVFVAEGEGRFTPRDVQVGRRGDSEVEVLSGIKEGEEVAGSATFFLDSESQLRSALRAYEPGRTVAPTPASALDVTLRTEPDPPRVGEDTLLVTVKDATGEPIVDADVSVVLFMPAMPTMNMPAMRHETRLVSAGAGVYRGTGVVMTPGRWDVTITISKSGKPVGAKQLALVAK